MPANPIDPSVRSWLNRGQQLQGMGVALPVPPPLPQATGWAGPTTPPLPEIIPAPTPDQPGPPIPMPQANFGTPAPLASAGPAAPPTPPPIPTTGYAPPRQAGGAPGMAPTPPPIPSPLVAPGAFTPAGQAAQAPTPAAATPPISFPTARPAGSPSHPEFMNSILPGTPPAGGTLPGVGQTPRDFPNSAVGTNDPALQVLRQFSQGVYGARLGDQVKNARDLPALQAQGSGLTLAGPGGLGATVLTPIMRSDGTVEVIPMTNPALRVAPSELGALANLSPAGVQQLLQSELQKGVDAHQMSPNNLSPEQALAKSILAFKTSFGVQSPDEKAHAQALQMQQEKLSSGEKVAGMETKSKEQIAREENAAKLEAARIAAQSAHLGAIAPFIAAGHQGPQLRQDIQLLTDAQKQYQSDKGPPLTGGAPGAPPAGGASPMGVPPELGGIGPTTPPIPNYTGPPLTGTPPPLPGQPPPAGKPPPSSLIPPPVPTVKEIDDIVNKYTGSNMLDVIAEVQKSPTANTPEGRQMIATRLQQLPNKGSITDMQRALMKTIVAHANQMHGYDVAQNWEQGRTPNLPPGVAAPRQYKFGDITANVNPGSWTNTTSIADATGAAPGRDFWHANLPLARMFAGQGNAVRDLYQVTRDQKEQQARAAAAIFQLMSQAAQQQQ